MAITLETVDRVHFGQFLKTIYLNAMHCARRVQLKEGETFEKRVVLEFMDSLYPTPLERRFTVDTEIFKHIIDVINFIQNDYFQHGMIPFHATIDRMERELIRATFVYILSRYRAMTCLYYNLYSESPFTLGNGLLPEGVNSVRDIVNTDRYQTGLNMVSTFFDHTESKSNIDIGITSVPSNGMSSSIAHDTSDPPKRGRGRPRKSEIVDKIQDSILENNVVEETVVTLATPTSVTQKPTAKKRGRPFKVKQDDPVVENAVTG